MTTSKLDENSIQQLKAAVRGRIIEPTDKDYDDARKVYNAMIDKKPRLIVRCFDVADVIASVNFARENGRLLAIRSGGHNAGGLGIADDALVIDLAQIKYTRVDPAARTVTVGGGCTWGDVDHATHTFNAGNPNCKEEIRQATGGGVAFAFELAGSVRALELAYGITRRGGMTVTAGLPPPSATFPLSPVNLVAEERTVKGSYIGTCVPSRDIPRYIDLYRQGKLAVNRLLSGRLKLEDINRGFDLLNEGKAVRQVVVFH